MNFKKIFKMQKSLDRAIVKEHNLDEEKITEKRIVALLVELGEFANEYAPFKYWKKNKDIDDEKVLEEFIDGIHFLSSLAIKHNVSEIVEPAIVSQDKSIQLAHTFKVISNLLEESNKETVYKALAIYLGNASLLNISDEDIERSYISKNKVNYQRLKNNY